jgi:hypothetical protein
MMGQQGLREMMALTVRQARLEKMALMAQLGQLVAMEQMDLPARLAIQDPLAHRFMQGR